MRQSNGSNKYWPMPVGPKAMDIYHKDKEGFKGYMFMKFRNVQDARYALDVMRVKCTNENGRRVQGSRLWCNFDLPIDQRVTTSFLFSLQRQLIEWKFPKAFIKVDTDLMILKKGNNKDIVTAKVVGDEFKLEWLDEVWAQWADLQNSTQLAAIRKTAVDNLARSRAENSKGVGKGPHQ